MGKASSSKKVARAARAGGTRRSGQRRNLGFPMTVAVVIIAGVALVFFARDEREASASPRPNEDHWHAAYGVYFCDDFQNPVVSQNDPLGIHTHGDGVIHTHPFLNSAAGTNARLGVFFDTVSLQVTDGKITMPDGSERTEDDDDCDGDAAIVQIARWASADDATAGEKPTEIITEDFDRIRFRADREAYTIAFLPEGEEIPPPPSIPTLDNLSDVIEAPTTTTESDDGSTTSTTGADGSTSTTAPVSTDSTSPDTSTSTSAP
jgi:hypothetical protein